MASEFFGLNRNADYSPDLVTFGTSTGSTDVEVRVDLTKNLTIEDIKLILEALIRWSQDARLNAPLLAQTGDV